MSAAVVHKQPMSDLMAAADEEERCRGSPCLVFAFESIGQTLAKLQADCHGVSLWCLWMSQRPWTHRVGRGLVTGTC